MYRRHTPEEENLLKKRIKLDNDIRNRSDFGEWNSTKFVSRKRHPLDCGNTRCGICSYEKRLGHNPTRQEKISEMKLEEDHGASQ